MTQPYLIRAIETDQYRLVQYQLDTGEYYFKQAEDDAPETLKTEPGGDVKLVPYSTISAYQDVPTSLVFLKDTGLTVVKSNPKVFLLKTLAEGHLVAHPIPLVTSDDPSAIRTHTNTIRALAVQRRLVALQDFEGVVAALNRAVAETTASIYNTSKEADESLAFLQGNMEAAQELGPRYAEVHRTTVEQHNVKLASYNELMLLTDDLLNQKMRIEQLTHDLQKKIKPIMRIADDMVRIT